VFANHRAFSTIYDLENASGSLGVFNNFKPKEHLAGVSIFYDFWARKRLVISKRFLKLPIQ
jgi:hypothetical protein